MAYTVEIADGSTTYTFDVSRTPEWLLETNAEWDLTKQPALLVRQTDKLTLRNASFRNATPSNVTTDFKTIRSQLFDPVTPIVSVLLKDGAAVIDKLQTTGAGGSHHQLMISRLSPKGGTGHFSGHWLADIVFEGVIFHASAVLAGGRGSPGDDDYIAPAGSGVIKRVRKFSIGHDTFGFGTRRVDVEIETAPGFSAEAAIQLEFLPLPGNNWFYTTYDPDNGIHINYTIDDEIADTRATGHSEVKEQALAIPQNANQYLVTITEEDQGEDREVRTVIQVQADTLAQAKAIVKAAPAPKSWQSRRITEEQHSNRVTATYVRKDDSGARVLSWSVFVQGGGGEREEVRIPTIGAKRFPLALRRPLGAIRFTESVRVRQKGDPNIKVPSLFDEDESLESALSSDTVRLVNPGAQPQDDEYERQVQRIHMFFEEPPKPAALIARMLLRPRPNQLADFGFERGVF